MADAHDPSSVRRSSATFVVSDCDRNGKTLFSKLAVDTLTLRTGRVPHIFDTDDPAGDLLNHYGGPDAGVGQIVSPTKTADQLKIFDGMLEADGRHFLVDLCARHYQKFFDIYRDTDFQAGADDAQLDTAIFFVLDRTEASLQSAASLRQSLPDTHFVLVRNPAIGDILSDPAIDDPFKILRPHRTITLPDLSGEALGMLEHPDFHFDRFATDAYDQFPFELKAELWAFLEALYEQRSAVGEGGTAHPL
ncbi:MAG: hypothetical protein AAGF28_04855 [Pseudomonadota bacterium]